MWPFKKQDKLESESETKELQVIQEPQVIYVQEKRRIFAPLARWTGILIAIPLMTLITGHIVMQLANQASAWTIEHVTQPAIGSVIMTVNDATGVFTFEQPIAARKKPTPQQLSQAYGIEDELAAAIMQDMSHNQPKARGR